MLQCIGIDELLPYPLEVINILVEKSNLVVGIAPRADSIEHDGYAGTGPETEQLAAGLDVGIIEDATRNIVKFATIYYGKRSRAVLIDMELVDVHHLRLWRGGMF